MPSAISTDEMEVLLNFLDLLRHPERYGCRFECPGPAEDQTGANQIVAAALAILDDLPAKRNCFPRTT